MTKRSRTPAGTNGGAVPAGAHQTLQHAPMLTKLWGRILAFLGILAIVALSAAVVKPEVGPYAVAIYLVAAVGVLFAAHKRLLD